MTPTLLDSPAGSRPEFRSRSISDCSPITSPRLRPKKVNVIPNDDDFFLDLKALKGTDNLKQQVYKLVKSQIHSWRDCIPEYIQLTPLSGAMTNCIYIAENKDPKLFKGPRKVLLRIYGVGAEQFVDRTKEIEWLAKLSTCDVGPRLLGTFSNGRLEEYLDSDTLTHEDIVNPNTSKYIARRMSDLHSIVNVYPPPANSTPEIWTNIFKWLPVAKKEFVNLKDKLTSDCYPIDIDSLETKANLLKTKLDSLNSPVVFAHNDAQYGNILRLRKTAELVVVDFEYAGYNHRGFDIANHFCEWMANYHTDAPHKLNPFDYPSLDQQHHFLKAYLKAQKLPESQLDQLHQEVEGFQLASHLMWGLWGIIQASTSTIDFDYLAYGTQRLHIFEAQINSL